MCGEVKVRCGGVVGVRAGQRRRRDGAESEQLACETVPERSDLSNNDLRRGRIDNQKVRGRMMVGWFVWVCNKEYRYVHGVEAQL